MITPGVLHGASLKTLFLKAVTVLLRPGRWSQLRVFTPFESEEWTIQDT